MKTIIVIIISFFLAMNIASAKDQKTSFAQDIATAIKSAKEPVKEIKTELCGSKTPQELFDEKYESIFKEISPALTKLLKEFHTHAEENAKKLENKSFKIKGVKNQEILEFLAEYLKEDRNELLEKQTKLDSTYSDKITEEILKQFYIENLMTATEISFNNWLILENNDHYKPFLKKDALQPKIVDRQKMIHQISIEYLEERKDVLIEKYKCLVEANNIIQKYKVGEIDISYNGKDDFEYISSLESILQGFFGSNKVKKQKEKMKNLYKSVEKDVYNVIDNATNIE